MSFRYLTEDSLAAVRTAAIELGFASDQNMEALVQDMPPAFVAAAMPGGSNAAARLFGFTSKLNTTRALVGGEVPLHLWLKAAIFLTAGRPQELVFRRALELSSADGVAEPSTGPLLSADVASDDDRGQLPRTENGLEVQIGNDDDTLSVGFLHAGAAASQSVAKILVHRHFGGIPSMLAGDRPDSGDGTGWLIARRLLITNFHVINGRGKLEPAATEQDFKRQGATAKVIFDYFTPGSQGAGVTAVECVAADRSLDFALLRLPDSTPERPPLVLRTSPVLKPADRVLKERINVLQHPNGEAMRLGFRNNFVVSGTEERLSYLTDTDGGASGSPLCDDLWFVAGLHRGFTTISDGPLMVWGQPISQENFGTPIPRIMSHLQQHHPDLHAEIAAQQAQPAPSG